MSRYIDAEKIDTRERGNNSQRTMWHEIERIICNAPTADVVEVVRCRDCKYFVDEDETDILGLCTCKRIAIAYNGELYPERDFYCPYGERREE